MITSDLKYLPHYLTSVVALRATADAERKKPFSIWILSL